MRFLKAAIRPRPEQIPTRGGLGGARFLLWSRGDPILEDPYKGRGGWAVPLGPSPSLWVCYKVGSTLTNRMKKGVSSNLLSELRTRERYAVSDGGFLKGVP